MYNIWRGQWNLSLICNKSTKIWPLTEQQNSGDQFCQIWFVHGKASCPFIWHKQESNITLFCSATLLPHFVRVYFPSWSHKQTALLKDTFSNSQGCPLLREVSVSAGFCLCYLWGFSHWDPLVLRSSKSYCDLGDIFLMSCKATLNHWEMVLYEFLKYYYYIQILVVEIARNLSKQASQQGLAIVLYGL